VRSVQLATKLVEDNQARVEVGTLAPLDVVQAQAMREAALKGWALGGPSFLRVAARKTDRRLLPLARGRRAEDAKPRNPSPIKLPTRGESKLKGTD
jgi:hypothetical protein